jgi:hypothetical protein
LPSDSDERPARIIAEMAVDVDDTGRDELAAAVDLRRPGGDAKSGPPTP